MKLIENTASLLFHFIWLKEIILFKPDAQTTHFAVSRKLLLHRFTPFGAPWFNYFMGYRDRLKLLQYNKQLPLFFLGPLKLSTCSGHHGGPTTLPPHTDFIKKTKLERTISYLVNACQVPQST